MNGVVNGDDFTQFAFGFNGGTPTWLNGDFDYNGVVNGDDFTLFAAGFNGQSAQLRPEEAPAAVQAVVPEPASIGLLAAGAFGLISRRRGRSRAS